MSLPYSLIVFQYIFSLYTLDVQIAQNQALFKNKESKTSAIFFQKLKQVLYKDGTFENTST